MEDRDFLFPKDLRVTPSNIKNVLFIGSCLAETYINYFKNFIKSKFIEDVNFDYIAFNNVADLPEAPPSNISSYDFQIIQIPLRYLVSDRVVKLGEFSSEDVNREITDYAHQMLKLMLEASMKYNREHGVLTFVTNFVVPQAPVAASLDRVGTRFDFSSLVRDLNATLANLLLGFTNAFVADVESLAGSIGKRYFLDDVVAFQHHGAFWAPWHRAYDCDPIHNAPPRIEDLPAIENIYPIRDVQMCLAMWDMFENMYRISNQIDMVKLVIFDLDDTMWRGLIGEHYNSDGKSPSIDGWPLGIWEAVQHLRARGILTAICSKNSPEIVEKRWSEAVPLLWVTLDDFLFKEIGWGPKAQGISKIISQASLTPKSVVFVDDNPVERASVKEALPGIRVIGANPYLIKRILLWSSETQIASVSSETQNRESMMRKQQDRESERHALSREDFLRSLNTSVDLVEITSQSDAAYKRCFELLNKTNQFNTTGERRSAGQMNSFLESGGKIYAFHVEDKYTKYGLVGVILYREGCFDQFAMSCRVLGMEIETSVVAYIVQRESELMPHLAFSARIRETESNVVCRDVFRRCGFVQQESELQVLPTGAGREVSEHVTISAPIERVAVAAV